jgi:prophage antirepressor-like protein
MTNETESLGQVVPFRYADGRMVRAVKDKNGQPWFALNDLCEILSLTNPARSATRLDADETIRAAVETASGEQFMRMVSRSGMYHLVLTSRVPEAVRLRQWVTRDVLPAIEEHGIYATDEKRAELANTTAMISGSMSSALQVLRTVPGAKAQQVAAHLEQVRQERVLGDLIGICGGAEAYKALL